MSLTKITNDNRQDALAAAQSWADENDATTTEKVDQWNPENISLMIDGGDWGVEFLPQDGWAYLHGFGTLNGLGTNIVHIEDINAGIDRLLGKIAE